MRIEPVYVIAPKSRAPSVPTRRAFLMVGASFAVGTTLGGACGYSLGKQGAAGAQPGTVSPGPEEEQKEARRDEPLELSGDADLDELRRLAVKAPIEELMGKARYLVDELHDTYPNDEILWQGIPRVCDALLSGYEIPDRRLFGVWLAQLIENADLKYSRNLLQRATDLRRLK